MHNEGPHVGEHGAHRHLVVVALDQPEGDSYIKQLGAYIGGVTGHRYTYIVKHGSQGIQPWRILNRQYTGGPAHPDVHEQAVV